jgi:membrane protease YdiL (CAAX protease family)
VPFSLTVVAVVFAWTWLLEPHAPAQAVVLVALVVVALTIWHDARYRRWGFDWRAFRPAMTAALAVTVPAAVVIIIAGALTGTLHDRRDFLGSFAALACWGLAQQWVLQTVIFAEARRWTSPRAGIWIAAAIFGAVHLPNPFLSAVTFVGALLWCRIYDRFPNIVPLAASHALGTLAILYAFDADITGRLRIGLSYLRFVG